jgi:glucose-1-phosphate thymidylyltransferase
MKALILAAGYATRLYPLTKEYPKPLLEVAGRPMIDYIVEKVNAIDDVDEIIVVTNSKFIALFEEWAAGATGQTPDSIGTRRYRHLGPSDGQVRPRGQMRQCSASAGMNRRSLRREKTITVVDDQTRDLDGRLGAIGDIRYAVEHQHVHDDLLVIGGDNLFDDGLQQFIAFAKEKRPLPVIGVHDIGKREQAAKYGVVKIGRDAAIIDFQEKPKRPESTLVAMCLYFFPKEKLGLISEYLDSKTDKKDATGYYIGWLTKREQVVAFIFPGRWYDIGHHEFYNKAKEHYRHGDA